MSSAKRRKFSPTPDEEEEDYNVEEVINMRVNSSGGREYLLKWVGFSLEHATWEPEDNVDCPELIEAFKKKERMKREERRNKEGATTEQSTSAEESNDYKKKMPRCILGVSKAPGELYFLVKFADDTAALLPSKEVNARWRPFVDEYVAFVKRALDRRQRKISGKVDGEEAEEEEPKLPDGYDQLVEKHNLEREMEKRRENQVEERESEETTINNEISMMSDLDGMQNIEGYQIIESLSNFAEVDESSDASMPPIFDEFDSGDNREGGICVDDPNVYLL